MITETMNAVVLTGDGGLDKLEFLYDYPTPKLTWVEKRSQ